MRKKIVYLAGLMTGLTSEEAMKWRFNAAGLLKDMYNCYTPDYDPKTNQTGKEIWDRDYYYVDNSDIVLVNFDYNNDKPFIGTSMEIARAHYQNKPIIMFSTKDWVHNSKTFNYHATKITKTLKEAIDYIKAYYY
ncbi:MAG: hypothetical protein ACOCP8_01770 [archaeon]